MHLPSLPNTASILVHVAMLFPVLGPVFSALPGPRAPAEWAIIMGSRWGSKRSGWGGSGKGRGSAKEFVSGGWKGEGVLHVPGGGRSGFELLNVGAWLEGEAMKGNGLGEV